MARPQLDPDAVAIRSLLQGSTLPTCDVAEALGRADWAARAILEDLEDARLVRQVPFVGWTWAGP